MQPTLFYRFFLDATRKQWFFKLRAGFGKCATCQGENLSNRVFEEILHGGYVAQTFPPVRVG